MKVLVIPEDFRNDQYILKPLFSRLFRRLGSRSVRVEVCRDPLLGGVSEALRADILTDIVQQYDGMTDMFILCVDRDGVVGRRQRLDQLESEFGGSRVFLAENAWEEIETWVLAGLRLPAGWNWNDVRAEVQVKETYFEPLADDARGVRLTRRRPASVGRRGIASYRRHPSEVSRGLRQPGDAAGIYRR